MPLVVFTSRQSGWYGLDMLVSGLKACVDVNGLSIPGCARSLIQQHGEWAEWKATERVVALLEVRDYEGVEAFLLVAETIARLQRASPAWGEMVH